MAARKRPPPPFIVQAEPKLEAGFQRDEELLRRASEQGLVVPAVAKAIRADGRHILLVEQIV